MTVTLVLVIVLVITAYLTLKDNLLFEKYLFRVDDILIKREFYRMVSSGFVHLDWLHLGFNALVLFLFGESVESQLTIPQYLFLYVGSLIGGNLLALYIHRQHGDYSAGGASGAISGIVFAYTLLYPTSDIGILFLPFHVNAVLFSFLYVLVSIYGIKSKRGNIGHEAHLGGAVSGLVLAGMVRPDVFVQNWDTFLILFLPTLIFLLLIWWKPEIMLIDGYTRYLGYRVHDQKRRTKAQKITANKEAEIDRILDKISQKGVESLTRKEKKILEEGK